MRYLLIPLSVAAGLLYLACGSARQDALWPHFTPTEQEKMLVEYLDRKLTIGSFMQDIKSSATDSTIFTMVGLGALRDYLLDHYVKKEIITREMARRGLDREPEVMEKIKMHREVLMAIYLFNLAVKDRYTFTKEELQRQYQQHKQKYQKHPRVNMRHLLVPTRAQADSLLALIQEGKKISDLARQHSREAFSRKHWGKSGSFPLGLGKYPEALERELSGMQIGELRGPIQTRQGYHIIKLIERDPGRQLSFRQALYGIRQDLKPLKEEQRLKEFTDSLRTLFPVTVFDSTLAARAHSSDIIAQVADHRIYVSDFQAAQQKMDLTGSDLSPAGTGRILETILQQKLMLCESYALRLDTTEYVERLLKPRIHNTLLRRFEQIEILDRIQVTEEMMRQFYHNRREKVVVQYIATKDKELAYQVQPELKKGATVAEIKNITKQRIRVQQVTWDRNEVTYRRMMEVAFGLSAPNPYSEVVEFNSPDDAEPNYYILIFKEKSRVRQRPYAQEKAQIEMTLHRELQQAERAKCYQRLYQEAHLRYYEENLKFFIDRWKQYLQQFKPG